MLKIHHVRHGYTVITTYKEISPYNFIPFVVLRMHGKKPLEITMAAFEMRKAG